MIYLITKLHNFYRRTLRKIYQHVHNSDIPIIVQKKQTQLVSFFAKKQNIYILLNTYIYIFFNL